MIKKYLIVLSAAMAVSIPAVPAVAQDKPAVAGGQQATQSIIRDIPIKGVRAVLKLSKRTPVLGIMKQAIMPRDGSGAPEATLYTTENSILTGAGVVVKKAESGESLEVQPGPYNKVIGAYFMKEYRKEKEGYAKARYFIFDRNGVVKLELKNIEGTMTMRPSPSGDYVIGCYGQNAPASGPIFFYGSSRKKAEGWPSGQHVSDAQFSPDGKIVGISANRSQTFFYDNHGRKLWVSPAGGHIAFSADSKRIVLGGTDQLLVLNHEGKKIHDINIRGVNFGTNFEISDDGSHIVLAMPIGIQLIQTETANLTWSWSPTDSSGLQKLGAGVGFEIKGLKLSQNGKVIAVAGSSSRMKKVELRGWGLVDRPENIAEHIILLADDRTITDEILLPPTSLLYFGTARFELSADGQALVVPTKTQVLRYALDQ